MSLSIPVSKTLLSDASPTDIKPLVGFDMGNDLYHILLFPIGADGGAIGIARQGNNFCARLSLDSLAAFYCQAKAEYGEGHG